MFKNQPKGLFALALIVRVGFSQHRRAFRLLHDVSRLCAFLAR